MKKRILALVLTAAMMIPNTAAYAAQNEDVPEEENLSAEELTAAEEEAVPAEEIAHPEAVDGIMSADESFSYVLNDMGEAVIVKYVGEGGKVIVPATLGGHKVTEIYDGAFGYQKDINYVALPSSVKTIGKAAFYGCEELVTLLMPGVTTIGEEAFAYTAKLEKALIPEGVTLIPDGAYEYSGVEEVYLPSSIQEIGDGAFQYCDKLQYKYYPGTGTQFESLTIGSANNPIWNASQLAMLGYSENYIYNKETGTILNFFYNGENQVTIPSIINNTNIIKLNNMAFENSEVEKVTVPEGVTEIGERCFDSSFVEEVVLPSTLKKVGDYAFTGTKLKKAELPSGVETVGNAVFDNCRELESAKIPKSVTSLGYETFTNATKLKTAVIEANITTFPENTFSSCEGLTQVSLPSTLTAIGDHAFNGCTSLSAIDIPDSVSVIGQFAFGSVDLYSVFIPSSITSIGNYAFDTDSLEWVYYPGTQAKWESEVALGTGAFDSKVQFGFEKKRVDLPTAPEEFKFTTGAGNTATITGYKGSKKDLVIPATLTKDGVNYTPTAIGEGAFAESDIESMEMPDTITKIHKYAFDKCENLKRVKLSANLTSIGKYAFHCCGLTGINLPGKLSIIEDDVFNGCYLENLVVPESVTKIGQSAFSSNERLKSAVIEGNPTSIGSSVFENTALESFEWPASVTTLPSNTFSRCKNLRSISLPSQLSVIGFNAFKECTALESIELPQNLTTIGSAAFENCVKLKKAVIPNSVGTLEQYAFYNCISLMRVEISSGVGVIADSTFSGCTNLSDIYFRGEIGTVAVNAFENCDALGKSGDVYYAKANNVYGEPGTTISVVPAGNSDFTSDDVRHHKPDETEKFLTDEEHSLKYFVNAGGDIEVVAYLGSDGNLVVPDKIGGKKVVKICDFSYDDRIRSAVIGENVTNHISFENDKNLESVVINAKIKELVVESFEQCVNLRQITLPDSLEQIQSEAFSGCTRLASIVIPDSVTSIGDSAFRECVCLESISLPAALGIVDEMTFEGCTSLENIRIPDDVTSIDQAAFYGCANLKTIVLPASLANVGAEVFKKTGLKTVYYKGTSTRKAGISIGTDNTPLEDAQWVCEYGGPDSISFTPSEAVVSVGETAEVTLSLKPADSTAQVTCAAVDPSVAEAAYNAETKTLTVKGLKSGTTRVDATAGGVSAYLYVYVKLVTPKAGWDGKEYLTGLAPGGTYTIDGEEFDPITHVPFKADENGNLLMVHNGIPAFANWFENSHEIVRLSPDNHKLDSKTQTIAIPAKGETVEPGPGGPDEPETEVPVPGGETAGSDMNRFDLAIDVKDENGNPVTLTVWVKKSVSYNGFVHKTNLDKEKPKKYSRDVTVSENISIASYVTPVVKVKNNKIVQVKEKKTPTVILSYKAKKGVKLSKAQKKVLKALNKQLKKVQKTQPITFTIAPANLSSLELTPKVNKKKTKVTKLTTVIDGRTVKLSKKDFDYTFSEDKTKVTITAKSKNFVGEKPIPLAN